MAFRDQTLNSCKNTHIFIKKFDVYYKTSNKQNLNL